MLEALIVVGFLDDRLLFLNNKAKLNENLFSTKFSWKKW
jgi:hypothetical protein